MKVLYVSRSHNGHPNPFVIEQGSVMIKNYPIEVSHYFIGEGPIGGYIKAIFQLPDIIKSNKIDIVHVHNGLSAFVVILSKLLIFRSMKTIITFHGSDINKGSKRIFSLFASKFSSHNILVSEKMEKFFKKNYSIIPCGIDTDVLLKYRDITRLEKSWGENDFIILFSSNFKRKEKDPDFAFEVVREFTKSTSKNVHFMELKGYTREQLIQLMQAADALIMCSHMEGSPQVIKESIINGLPVISNNVGDVEQIIAGIDNCFLVKKDVGEFVKCLHRISKDDARVKHRSPVIEKFDNNLISDKLYRIYNEVQR